MAKRIVHQLIDDLDGTELQDGKGETVRFGLDGKGYEIDLSSGHAASLREVLAPYIEAGRRSSQTPTRAARTGSKSTTSGNVREWAVAQGLSVPARGRVPQAVLEAYRAAH